MPSWKAGGLGQCFLWSSP
uniref:Uncharacterized protein n=1 Tax=Anguilla anguilla TaxID=7936 RepID=A0A0E9Q3Z1_ANGAN